MWKCERKNKKKNKTHRDTHTHTHTQEVRQYLSTIPFLIPFSLSFPFFLLSFSIWQYQLSLLYDYSIAPNFFETLLRRKISTFVNHFFDCSVPYPSILFEKKKKFLAFRDSTCFANHLNCLCFLFSFLFLFLRRKTKTSEISGKSAQSHKAKTQQ